MNRRQRRAKTGRGSKLTPFKKETQGRKNIRRDPINLLPHRREIAGKTPRRTSRKREKRKRNAQGENLKERR